MIIPAIMFPDTCNIRPIKSGGHAPGAEDSSVPDTAVLNVICNVQDMRDSDLLPADSRGRQTVTQVYFRDEDATRDVIAGLPTNSILEIVKSNGVTLSPPTNIVVNRTTLDALGGVAVWRADCITRL